MLTLIGIVLFFASEMIYDRFAPHLAGTIADTNWLILYFASHYIAIAFVCLDQSLFNFTKWMRWIFTLFGLLSFCYSIIELSLLNVPYEAYIIGIENKIVSNISLFIITFITGIISYSLWHKRLKEFLGRLLVRL